MDIQNKTFTKGLVDIPSKTFTNGAKDWWTFLAKSLPTYRRTGGHSEQNLYQRSEGMMDIPNKTSNVSNGALSLTRRYISCSHM